MICSSLLMQVRLNNRVIHTAASFTTLKSVSPGNGFAWSFKYLQGNSTVERRNLTWGGTKTFLVMGGVIFHGTTWLKRDKIITKLCVN